MSEVQLLISKLVPSSTELEVDEVVAQLARQEWTEWSDSFDDILDHIIEVYTKCKKADITNKVGLLLVKNIIITCSKELEEKRKPVQSILASLERMSIDVLPIISKQIKVTKSTIIGGDFSQQLVIVKLASLGVIFNELVRHRIFVCLLSSLGFVECFLTFCDAVWLTANPGIKHHTLLVMKEFTQRIPEQLKNHTNNVHATRFLELMLPIFHQMKDQGEQALRVTLLLMKHFYVACQTNLLHWEVRTSLAELLNAFCKKCVGQALLCLKEGEKMGEQVRESAVEIRCVVICTKYLESFRELSADCSHTDQVKPISDLGARTCTALTRSAFHIASATTILLPILKGRKLKYLEQLNKILKMITSELAITVSANTSFASHVIKTIKIRDPTSLSIENLHEPLGYLLSFSLFCEALSSIDSPKVLEDSLRVISGLLVLCTAFVHFMNPLYEKITSAVVNFCQTSLCSSTIDQTSTWDVIEKFFIESISNPHPVLQTFARDIFVSVVSNSPSDETTQAVLGQICDVLKGGANYISELDEKLVLTAVDILVSLGDSKVQCEMLNRLLNCVRLEPLIVTHLLRHLKGSVIIEGHVMKSLERLLRGLDSTNSILQKSSFSLLAEFLRAECDGRLSISPQLWAEILKKLDVALVAMAGSEVDYTLVCALIVCSAYCLKKAIAPPSTEYPFSLLEKILLVNHQWIRSKRELFYPAVEFLAKTLELTKFGDKDKVPARNLAETAIDIFKTLMERALRPELLDMLIEVIRKVPNLNLSRVLPRGCCDKIHKRLVERKMVGKLKSEGAMHLALQITISSFDLNMKKSSCRAVLEEASEASCKSKFLNILNMMEMPNKKVLYQRVECS